MNKDSLSELELLVKSLERILDEGNFAANIELTGNIQSDNLVELLNKLLAEVRQRDEKIALQKKSLKSQIEIHTSELEESNKKLVLDKREAETSSLSKSVFLANLSHELRTPLNHIIGYSEMLLEEMEEEGMEDFLPDLKKIRGSSNNLMKWVEEIIDLSKIESGRSELNYENFSVEELANELSQKVQEEMAKSENELTLNCPTDVDEIHGDRERIFRTLFNLVMNACHTTKNGKVSINISCEQVEDMGWISFVIKDTGAGINPKILENLFKGYTNADEKLSSGFGGEALMLAICHRLSLVMGGNIYAESELGVGSTFTLRLPMDMKTHLSKPHVVRATNLFIQDILKM
ncbi:MAG: ATP-binding protein [Nitrospinota bacterium]